MKNKIPLFISILFSFSACKDEMITSKYYYQTENALNYEDKYTLQVDKEKQFSLDNDSRFLNYSLQCYTLGGKRFFSFFNEYKNALYIYNYDNSKIEQIITFESEGPNGLNSDHAGYYIAKDGRLFLLDYWKGQLHLFDETAKKIKTYISLQDQLFVPSLCANYPLVEVDNQFFIENTGQSFYPNQTLYTQLKLNIETGDTSYITPIPDLYQNACWGANLKYHSYTTFNEKERVFVHSYGVDPFLKKVTLDGVTSKHYVSSKYFEAIEPVTENINDCKKLNIDQLGHATFTTPMFKNIMYDKWNDMYYRFAYLPMTQEEYDNHSPLKISIILMDQDFKKIGETKMPIGIYQYEMMFINENGLHIANESKNGLNENILTFDIFKPIPIH